MSRRRDCPGALRNGSVALYHVLEALTGYGSCPVTTVTGAALSMNEAVSVFLAGTLVVVDAAGAGAGAAAFAGCGATRPPLMAASSCCWICALLNIRVRLLMQCIL